MDTPPVPLGDNAFDDFLRHYLGSNSDQDEQSTGPRNTLTGQPRDPRNDYDDKMMRYTWALFGHLVDMRIISVPNFDHVDDKDIVQAAEDVHSVIMSLSLALMLVFREGNQIP